MKNEILKDFKNGIKLAFIGISGIPAGITSMEEVAGGFRIRCDHGNPFHVSIDRIHYANTL